MFAMVATRVKHISNPLLIKYKNHRIQHRVPQWTIQPKGVK